MKIVKSTAAITAAAAVLFGLLHHFLPAGPPPDAEPYLSQVFPGAASYEKVSGGEYPYYVAVGTKDTLGALFVTTDLAPGVRGYAGPVPVLTGMDVSGRITGIRVLENKETPSYLRRVDRPGFTGQFTGKTVRDGFVLDADVDGVTRATVTAAAVAGGVRLASRRAASELFGIDVPGGGPGALSGLMNPAVYALLALFAVAVALYLAARRGKDVSRLRYALLLAALVFLGVYKASPLALGNLFNLAALRLPGPENLFWFVLVGGPVLLALVFGRVYCGWACPFGALQELIAALPVRKLRPPPGLDRKARGIKYGLLWLVTVAAFVTGLLEMGDFEPYGTLFSGYGGALAWALVGATLGAGVFVPRFWCRYLCPVGAVLGLASGARPGAVRFDGCTACGRCSGECGMGNREGGEAGFTAAECIGCGRCVSVCPQRGAATGSRAAGRDAGKAAAGDVARPGRLFKALLLITCAVTAAVVVSGAVTAYRMSDPEYARTVEDRAYFEQKITPSGLTLAPAGYWKSIEKRSEGAD